MSLHHLAEQVRAAGRKNDKVLVHMTPNEVNGLQALALAHGGSLTINPDTGLPEADFLDAILPMAAGFLLAPLTAGTSLAFLGATPLASALTVGAGYTLATGSLEKGLMAGLGAYGGAGLGAAASSGVTAAGTTASGVPAVGAKTVASAPTQSLFGGQAMQGGVHSSLAGTAPGYTGYATTLSPSAVTPFVPAPSTASIIGNSPIVQASQMAPVSPISQANLLSSVNPNQATMAGINNSVNLSRQAASVVPTVTQTAAPASTSMFSNYSMPTDWGQFYDKLPTGTLPALAVTGMQAMKPKQSGLGALPTGDAYERPYEYSVEQDPLAYADDGSTRERVYFTEPRFRALPIRKVADGGLMEEPAGNVERMSEGNVQEMQSQEDNIPRYAFGGSAAFATAKAKDPEPTVSYSYDPATMQYTSTTTTPPAAQDNRFSGIPGMGFFNPAFSNVTMRGFGGIGSGQGVLGNIGRDLMGFGAQKMPAPQPTVTTQTMGGMSTPFVPQGMNASAPLFTNSNIAPNINIPEQQTPEQQLGLQGFYQNMEKQLAAKGAQIMSQNMANGGIAKFGGGGAMQYANPEAEARHKYAAEHGTGIIKTVPDNEWNMYKKLQNLSFNPVTPAPQYMFDPVTQQFTDIGTKEQSMGIAAPFMPSSQIAAAPSAAGIQGYQGYADGGMAEGGYNLGGYSDGGRLLKGPGDGVSDSIPAVIGDRQPARLADGEFVVPARIVSELGNGSTEAGAKKLYAMMNRVQNARKKSIGKGKVAVNSKAEKLLPA